jgi:hypothetical protein
MTTPNAGQQLPLTAVDSPYGEVLGVAIQSYDAAGTLRPVGEDYPLPSSDLNSRAFYGEFTMTADTVYSPGRSLKIICTTAGNVRVTYSDGSTGDWPAIVGTQVLAVEATEINSASTTAVATYRGLK